MDRLLRLHYLIQKCYSFIHRHNSQLFGLQGRVRPNSETSTIFGDKPPEFVGGVRDFLLSLGRWNDALRWLFYFDFMFLKREKYEIDSC